MVLRRLRYNTDKKEYIMDTITEYLFVIFGALTVGYVGIEFFGNMTLQVFDAINIILNSKL